MSGVQAALLEDGERLHLQHGPIDLIIGADPKVEGQRRAAFEAATTRFHSVMDELTQELALLRSKASVDAEVPAGSVAGRMHAAVLPHSRTVFVTPMAAVAGAVADEVLYAMADTVPLSRAYVNNGGDIALLLTEETSFKAAIGRLTGASHGTITVPARSGVRGIATSGFGGRSLTLGIAESVTVLARSAAEADVAATLIANAVTLPDHPSIRYEPANARHPDSDLGDTPVVVEVGLLSHDEVALALDRGLSIAFAMKESNLIVGAYLALRGQNRLLGRIPLVPGDAKRLVANG